MNYYFSGEINKDSVCDLINFLNDHPEHVTIYLSSYGGDHHRTDVLIDIINNRSDKTKLIAINYIESSAFRLFFSVKCEKEIKDLTYGCFHQPYQDFTLSSTGLIYDEEEKYKKKRLKKIFQQVLLWAQSIGMNEKEIGKFTAGKDIYFSHGRLVELLQKQKNKPMFEDDIL